MKNTLVAFFSCSGVTCRVAKELAESIGAELFEIRPETPYSAADLNWMDKQSRTTKEKNDPAFRPGIADRVEHMEQFDTVFVGFPIWWYTAPNIIHTFLESYDFSGKTVVPFATSGSSGMGNTTDDLRPSCTETTKWGTGKLWNDGVDAAALRAWAEQQAGK